MRVQIQPDIRFIVYVVVAYSVAGNTSSSVVTEGVSCYSEGQVGEYTTYSACQSRKGNSFEESTSEAAYKLQRSHKLKLVCCRSSSRDTGARNYQRNSFQTDENHEIETISELKETLENPKFDEVGRRKHSIDPNPNGRRDQNILLISHQHSYNVETERYLSTPKNGHYNNEIYKPSGWGHSPTLGEQESPEQNNKRTTTHRASNNHSEHQPFTGNEPEIKNTYDSRPVHFDTHTTTKRPNYYQHQQTRPHTADSDSSFLNGNHNIHTSTTMAYESQWAQPLIEDENGYPIFPAPPTSTRRPHDHKKKRRMRISEKKCKEYSEIVQETIAGLPLLTNPKPLEFNIDKCNYNAQQLIVGGQNASLGEFPHMAAVGFTDDQRNVHWNCGGSLISESFVLTAAHCTTSRFGDPTFVRIGDHNLKRDDDGAHPVQYYVKNVVRHPEYRPHSRYHDIALLRLSRPVTITPHIRPACIYQKPNFVTNKTVASGWGRIAFHQEQSDDLLKVVLDIIDNDKCNYLYRAESQTEVLSRGITSQQMCAGDLNGGKDTCQGDSGGPIEVSSHSNQCIHYIIGVTSFGKKCGLPNAPGVYTRVSSYVSWIESVVWPNL